MLNTSSLCFLRNIGLRLPNIGVRLPRTGLRVPSLEEATGLRLLLEPFSLPSEIPKREKYANLASRFGIIG